MARPRLSELDTWGNHEHRVMETCVVALNLLCREDGLSSDERDVNRRLYFMIHRARRALHANNMGLSSPPSFDANNCPDADDEERAPREGTRPDFTFAFYDDQEADPDRSAKSFVVECKRLGSPSGRWVFNKNYIRLGVNRFIKAECGYGKSVESGAMIGYIQSMRPPDVLAEVNEEGGQNALPMIRLSGGWQEDGVSRLEQSLIRSHILPKAFHLHHLWVDLRRRTTRN